MTISKVPKRTDKPVEEICLTGKLFPWRQEQPVYMGVGHSEYLYLPVYDEEWLLRETMGKAKAPFDKIKRIDDGAEFLTSFPPKVQKLIRIAVNFRFTPEGKTRWTEIQWQSVRGVS